MTMMNDVKFLRGIDLPFQNWHEEFDEFDPSTRKSQKFALFDKSIYNVWAKKVQRSYIWEQWRLMQDLKENWPVLSKITWECGKFSQAEK